MKHVYPLDISEQAQKLFVKQMDTFILLVKNQLVVDSIKLDYFYKNASIFYYKNGINYGCRFTFGKVLTGCGYHECDEPHKITVVNNRNTKAIPEIYDFKNTSAWLSSKNWKQDKIQINFAKNSPPLTKLIFFTGDQSTELNWQKYSRPKTIKVLVNNKFWGILEFEDRISKQEFEFSPIKTKRKNIIISLIILETYKGESESVAISEINFDGWIH